MANSRKVDKCMIAYVGKEPPRKRGSREKVERNVEIVKLHMSGETYEKIAAVYNIDKSRVAQIVERARRQQRVQIS